MLIAVYATVTHRLCVPCYCGIGMPDPPVVKPHLLGYYSTVVESIGDATMCHADGRNTPIVVIATQSYYRSIQYSILSKRRPITTAAVPATAVTNV